MIKSYQQVKLSSIGSQKIFSLFNLFKLRSILSRSCIRKQKGHSISEILFYLLLITLENSRSIYNGLFKNQISNLKTPINDMLNHPHYNWRDFLYRVAKRFSQLCATSLEEDGALIFDDTSKEKTGHKTSFIAWFYDHCKDRYFKGYQNVTCCWSSSKTIIPIDFELKRGKTRTKHASVIRYPRKSHIEQRVRFAGETKGAIVMRMLNRAMQRRFSFKYILWDSWYNQSKSFIHVFSRLVPHGKVLISMMKKGNQKYRYKKQEMNLKELYIKAGKWQHDRKSGIKFKSILVEILDPKSSYQISNRTTIGKIRICFYKYPNRKQWKAILSTELSIDEMNEMKVLKVYLRRWGIECVFKEIRQYFGYDQNRASNYAAMVADLTIRYVFYILFCYRKKEQNQKPMGQIVAEFYQELFDLWLTSYIEILLTRAIKDLLDYAIEIGYSDILLLKKDLDNVLIQFFERETIIDKITDADIRKFRKIA